MSTSASKPKLTKAEIRLLRKPIARVKIDLYEGGQGNVTISQFSGEKLLRGEIIDLAQMNLADARRLV